MRRSVLILMIAVIGCGVLAATLNAATIGPGLVTPTGADSGDRLNVDDTFPQVLAAGRYLVTDFRYNATATADGVVPFLATSSGTDQYQLLWIGSSLSGVNATTTSTDPVGGFTLGASTSVYAGFYTTNGGRVAFTTMGSQTTDHAGTVNVPTGGNTIGGFSNPNLNRTYAFSITADPNPLLTVGPNFLSNQGADGGERLNIDQSNSLNLAAGTYNVKDFSFIGTSAAGTVTPMLLRSTGANSYETVWVGGTAASVIGGVSVNPGGSFTLGSAETLFAGFFTAGGARVAFTTAMGVTDHANSFTAPTGVGQTINVFSNPDLVRQYSFAITVPEPSTAGLFLAGIGVASMLRKKRVFKS